MSASADLPATRRPGRRIGPMRVLQAALGIAFLGFAAWLLWDFPAARPWLWGLALLLLVLQRLDSRSWLIALPVLFAVVDLGAWSGRVLLTEQDALLAVLIGTALLAGHYAGAGSQLIRPGSAPLWLLALVLAVGFVRGLTPVSALDANAWNGYLTGWNALRIVKGPAWALLFWPLLAKQFAEDRQAIEGRLALGMAAALTALGVWVLWERGLANDLLHARDIWGLFASWLDLSSSYRITGPFSQMHLGGEAIDGFLMLSWPFALYLLFRTARWPLILLALLTLALGAYGLMVTFTRATYAAAAVAFFVFGITSMLPVLRANWARFGFVAILLGVFASVFVHGFRIGGTLTTAGFLFVLTAAMAAGIFVPRGASRALLVLSALCGLLVLALGASLSLHGMLTSKWSDVDRQTAMATVAWSTALLGAGGLTVGCALRPWAATRAPVMFATAVAIVLPMFTLAVSGYQIGERFASVSRDANSRISHWRNVLSLVPDDGMSAAFGVGPGRFPLARLLAVDKPTGTWHFGTDDSQRFLRLLGGGSLCFGQRLTGLEPGTYRVEAWVRNPSKSKANLAVKLQPRRLLEAESWQPATKQLNFPIEPGGSAWKRVAGALHLDRGSAPPWHDPRFAVFALTNQGESHSAVDVARVRLVDGNGRDVLANGDFAAGGDRWFAYNDFHHLEWHAKNLFVALYFDMGWFGISAFAVLVLVALGRGLQQARRGSLFAAATTAALAGFVVLGAAGTLLDVPQLMTLFVLLTAAMLARPPAR